MPSHPLPPAEPPPDEELPRRRAGRSALIVEDFRSVRRWLVLLGVLAVAAAAVAAYSLLQSEESADRDRVNSLSRSLRDATAQLEEANRQRKLEGRQLERRLGSTSEESDVAKLDRRLRGVERDVVDAVDAAASSGRALSRLDDRIDALSDRLTAVEDRRPRRR
ncbi:MAG: hypothetical protein H0U25_05485 [Thermoleophilaceae bacterium]|nr:hypothetical protein [Thermoleophilaceae bacterium]